MSKRKGGPSAAVKLQALRRDRFRCAYCGTAGTDAELEVDHVVPVAKGGSHNIANLATACRLCNQRKSDGPAPTRRHVAAAPQRQPRPIDVGECMERSGPSTGPRCFRPAEYLVVSGDGAYGVCNRCCRYYSREMIVEATDHTPQQLILSAQDYAERQRARDTREARGA